MTIPSNSAKYVCTGCHAKILSDDLEFIFLSQIDSLQLGYSLQEKWSNLSETNKQRVIEHLCERIVVARESISIRFACDTSLFKRKTDGQHRKVVNGTAENVVPTDAPNAELTEPLMSETEAAALLGISKLTLLRKRNAGLIGFFRVGFRVLYSKEKHLVPYLSACEVRRLN